MDLDQSVCNMTESEYSEYAEWLEIFCQWDGISEHVIHNINFKELTYDTHNLIFCYNLHSTE